MPECRRLVAIVDDDEAIRETLSFLLQDEGYETTMLSDGREALDSLRADPSKRPCLILLDVMMPIMTGPECYAELQKDPALATIPVCLLSADRDLRQKATALGCPFLAKPVLIEQILEVVERHCGAAKPA